jgi:glycine cleavage system H lipoate-binding protein
MVLALVLATFVVLIAVQWALTAHRSRVEQEQRLLAASEGLRPEAVSLHPGMAWVGPLSRRAVSVGASDFAVDFTGRIAAVDLPRVGQRLREGDPAIVLRSERGRRLTLAAPLPGRVLAVNPDPAADPSGWMLRIRPQDTLALPALLQGSAARRWVDEAKALLMSRLDPAVGRIAQDGGVFQHAWGELLDDRTWTELEKELFPETGGRRTS